MTSLLPTVTSLTTVNTIGATRHLLHPVTKRLLYKLERNPRLRLDWQLYRLTGGAWRRVSYHRTFAGAQFAALSHFADNPGTGLLDG
jgi:hypothetical protein